MDISVLQSYVHVVENGSFSAAAKLMGISKSICSKHISDLETQLGSRLLSRSTRAVTPTAVGLDYYEKVKLVLAELNAANESVRTRSEKTIGHIKIGAPISYTLKFMRPLIFHFMKTFPDNHVELVMDDRQQDIVGGGFDAIIRIGELDDSSFIARRLSGSKVHLVASPAYLAEHGMPKDPADLVNHRCLYYTNMRGTSTWRFSHHGQSVQQRISPVFSSNNGDIIRSATKAGLGISLAPEFLIEDDLANGLLVPILTDFELPEIPINLVYPSRKNITAAFRAFLDAVPRCYDKMESQKLMLEAQKQAATVLPMAAE